MQATRGRQLRGEVLICGLGFGLIALLMCAAHIRNGGRYYDDWSLIALGRFSGSGGLLHSLWLDYGQRPGQVLYYAALDGAFGSAASPRLALAAVMVVLQGTCLYVLLRSLSVRARDAAAVAALALTFPFSDSLWLWGVLSLTSLAISAALIGLILAPRALRSSGRRALALHAASLALYVGSILGAPASVGPGVPVLDTTLDLSSAMRISYSDPQLTGVPIGASASIACGTRGPLVAGVAGIYGDAYLLDISDRRAIRLLDRRQCIAAARVSAFA